MVRLRLLGGARLDPGDAPLPPDQLLWLSALLATRDSPLSRERITALLWPDADPDAARNRLRQLLHRLRRTSLAQGVRVGPAALAWTGACDVGEFRGLMRAAAWEAALEVYRGPLLEGVALPASEALEAWLHEERARLHEQHLRAAHEAARSLGERHDPRRAAEVLARAHEADPASALVAGRLARALHAIGETERALRVLERHREHLGRELNEAPPAELLALAARWRSELAVSAEVAQLPAFLTTFEGRQPELDIIGVRLTDPGCRWVTLTGQGGVGKSRLAAEAARRVASRFPHGAVFVALTSLDSPDLLAPAILEALGERLKSAGEARTQLIEALATRNVLLILDNFEHLLEGAGLLPELLAACPEVKLLVTSRQRLNFQAEWVVSIPGLDLPPDVPGEHDWRAHPASRLFVERASRAESRFDADACASAVRAIVRRCEGLPLAIELAAAWASDFSASDIAGRLEHGWDFLVTTLRDVPVRHRSLRVVFEHSWQSLTPHLQGVYAALAVLRAPFGAVAASRVANALQEDLDRLEQRSLLQRHGDGRYAWHQNLREYALEKLGAVSEVKARERHLAHFAGVAQEAAPLLRGAGQAQELARLAEQLDDLRSALAYAQRERHHALGLSLAGALHWFWYVRGHHEEGLRWLEVFLEHSSARGAAHAAALAAAGALSVERGLHERGARRHHEALGIYRRLGDLRGEAEVLHMLGVLHRDLGEFVSAEQYLTAARALRERLDDAYGLGMTLNDLGVLWAYQDDEARAGEYFERSLELKRRVGDTQGIAYALGNLGNVAPSPHERLRLYRESLGIKRTLGDVQACANTLVNCAVAALDMHELTAAQAHFTEALTLYARLGKMANLGVVLAEVARLEQMRGRPQHALELASAALSVGRHTRVPLAERTRAGLEDLVQALRPLAPRAADTERRGASLTPAQAVALALEELTAVASPARPDVART